jgi:hypothetical protein
MGDQGGIEVSFARDRVWLANPKFVRLMNHYNGGLPNEIGKSDAASSLA